MGRIEFVGEAGPDRTRHHVEDCMSAQTMVGGHTEMGLLQHSSAVVLRCDLQCCLACDRAEGEGGAVVIPRSWHHRGGMFPL